MRRRRAARSSCPEPAGLACEKCRHVQPSTPASASLISVLLVSALLTSLNDRRSSVRCLHRGATRLRGRHRGADPQNLLWVMPAKGDDISSRADVLIIGAGVIGLSVGWRAAQ